VNLVEASGHTDAANNLVVKINQIILYPLITFLLALAVLLFIWGAFKYLYKADDPGARKEGQTHMMFGIIGIVVMVSALSLLQIAVRTFFGDAAVPNP
jgi:NhaP-type Na+/H+ or K+/H+ antiporter